MEHITGLLEELVRGQATHTERLGNIVKVTDDQERRLRSLEQAWWKLAGILAVVNVVVVPVAVAVAVNFAKGVG